MTNSTPRVRPQDGSSWFRIAIFAIFVAVAALALAEWADREPPRPGGQELASTRLEPERARSDDVAPVAAWAREPQRAMPVIVAAPPSRVAQPATEVSSRVADEARARMEDLRNYMDASCWIGRAAERKTARVTFNLTFDAQGREIARGISEDRRAPAPELGRCLRRLQGTTLAIAPTGANVGVSLPMTFP